MTTAEEIRVKAVDLYASGATMLEVAQCFHISERSIARWCKEAGVTRPPGPRGPRGQRPELPDDSLAYAGDWVRVGLILRPVSREVVDPEPEATIRTLPVALDTIACPTCHATLAQHCRSNSGRKLKADGHSNRLIPRTCECGAELAPRRQLCALCRAESDRRRSRESKQRSRTAA